MPFRVATPEDTHRIVRQYRWNVWRGIGALLFIFIAGAVGFKIIEGDEWTWLDSFYMAIITMSTVGFQEVRPLSEPGRIFSMFVITFGVGGFAYTFATLGERILSGQLVEGLRQRGTRHMLRRLRSHHIVVGYGNTGSLVADQLSAKRSQRVVVIDSDGAEVERASTDGFVAILGDAGQDDILDEAGIDRAASMICAVSPDSAALMVVLSARVLAPDLNIIARATQPDTESKLLRAGASRVISVHDIAADRIVSDVLEDTPFPDSDAISVMIAGERFPLVAKEAFITESGGFVGKTIRESGIYGICHVDIASVKRGIDSVVVDAGEETLLEAGDALILAGAPDHVEEAATAIEVAQSRHAAR